MRLLHFCELPVIFLQAIHMHDDTSFNVTVHTICVLAIWCNLSEINCGRFQQQLYQLFSTTGNQNSGDTLVDFCYICSTVSRRYWTSALTDAINVISKYLFFFVSMKKERYLVLSIIFAIMMTSWMIPS